MVSLFLDESGSMTCEFCKTHPFFVVSILYVKDTEILKKSYKKFIRSNFDRLRTADTGKMFKDGTFYELKGAEFTPELKTRFVEFFSKSKVFKLFYIVLENSSIDSKYYKNTARAFNYIIVKAIKYFIQKKYLPKGETYHIQIDERNQRADAKRSLEDYLYSELYLADATAEDIKVTYFDSANNKMIQLADVFANLYYSHLRTGKYKNEIALLEKNDILLHVFRFPLHK